MNLQVLKPSEKCQEQELERILGDQLARLSMANTSGSRIQKMQNLLAKAAALNEMDFEVVMRAMDGILQSTLSRNLDTQKNRSKSEKAKELKQEVSGLTSQKIS